MKRIDLSNRFGKEVVVLQSGLVSATKVSKVANADGKKGAKGLEIELFATVPKRIARGVKVQQGRVEVMKSWGAPQPQKPWTVSIQSGPADSDSLVR